MASDDPVEPIHGIERTDARPVPGIRERGYRLFTRFLENTLLWKRFQLSNEMNKRKKGSRDQKPQEPDGPGEEHQVDKKA